jgi:hypothetical protein
VAGSVAPDFEYFIRMKVLSIYSHHTWFGVLWFDVPMAILICFVYHDVVKAPLVANLPLSLNRRFNRYQDFNWNKHFVKNYMVMMISIIIGIASHLFWDSFTHATGYFVNLWHMESIVQIGVLQIPLYKIVQHLSTLVGGVVIVVAVYQMPVQAMHNNSGIVRYWLWVTVISSIIIAVRLVFGLSLHQYWNLIVTVISACIVGVILTSLISKR